MAFKNVTTLDDKLNLVVQTESCCLIQHHLGLMNELLALSELTLHRPGGFRVVHAILLSVPKM